jgi:hypothetical protein
VNHVAVVKVFDSFRDIKQLVGDEPVVFSNREEVSRGQPSLRLDSA